MHNTCAETHLGGGDTSAFVSPWPPLLERSLRLQVAVPFLGKAHEDSDHTAVIAVVNPLTTEFFPPRPHIFMHSAHTTFVGTPLPQHSLLSGQTWWGPHTWRDPSGNTVNDIHDPPTSPAIGGQRWMSAGFSPSISLNLGQI